MLKSIKEKLPPFVGMVGEYEAKYWLATVLMSEFTSPEDQEEGLRLLQETHADYHYGLMIRESDPEKAAELLKPYIKLPYLLNPDYKEALVFFANIYHARGQGSVHDAKLFANMAKVIGDPGTLTKAVDNLLLHIRG